MIERQRYNMKKKVRNLTSVSKEAPETEAVTKK
jgi:hypothetical protein